MSSSAHKHLPLSELEAGIWPRSRDVEWRVVSEPDQIDTSRRSGREFCEEVISRPLERGEQSEEAAVGDDPGERQGYATVVDEFER